jgi:hypothetical protein
MSAWDPVSIVGTRQPISLAELSATAALRTRVDRKYVLDAAVFAALAERLGEGFRVLEINGSRTFRYDTVYYDSSSLIAYRSHLQQRRRRYKVRSRHYVDSGLYLFEVKLKGRRGETVKHQMPYRPEDHGHVNDEARSFLDACLASAYPQMAVPELAPTVRTSYRRLTLAAGAERVTCDFDLRFSDGEREIPGLDPRYVILESKVERGLGEIDRELRRLGVRPVSCSKYCVGVGLLRDDVKVNDLHWLLNRYFSARDRSGAPPTEKALAHG